MKHTIITCAIHYRYEESFHFAMTITRSMLNSFI